VNRSVSTVANGRLGAVTFAPVRAGLLVSDIHARIREAILAGLVEPGQPLRDSTLAEQMQVSRSPVREALRMLEQSGLVTKRPNRPYVVVEFDETDVRELAGMRAALETLAVRLIVHRGEPVSGFEDELAALRAAVEGGIASTIVRADRRFHRAVVNAAGNHRLTTSYDGLRDQIVLAMLSSDAPARGHAGLVQRHVDLVAELVGAIGSGDAGEVIARFERHILDGMDCPGLF
jgi:DNA-binding GntR family transcriptional regulator